MANYSGESTINTYIDEVKKQFYSGQAREHSYRPALERLMMSINKVHAVNEPKHSEHGAPDFVFLSDNNKDLILGYAEAKDIGVSLDLTEKTEQMKRYHGYANLFLTDYLEFRFFRNGEKYQTIALGTVKNGVLYLTPENGNRLMLELEAFLEQTPESITSGKRLSAIMGGKARRIRDNILAYLDETDKNNELARIYEMMKHLLVHDLSTPSFADMYAQTLVYGLFVARYNDTTPNDFNRSEARDLVPTSNPFLRQFFDHIVGPNFDKRLGYIVDELCEIFSVSDVNAIVHKHLKITDTSADTKDPIIHFYEDFLQEYDPLVRKQMGAYYTPIPVVKYIINQVDKILKEDFAITNGIASSETTEYYLETGQDQRLDKRHRQKTGYSVKIPRVQILDPAVGTATFLNETIKFIHQKFTGQEGRWPSYVNDSLVNRLYGFELMMAPYTIAHLKLGMTLKETGVNKLNNRLGVYLTNTLEEGIVQQSDLFSFGLAEAVSQESRLASEIKSEKPVMVVMGNPPYSVSSSNKSKYIQSLIKDYKKDLNERKTNLDDDYIKFIRFAEEMITKNGSGVVAMITNNSYLDGITHRQMRKHLLQTFNKIYVLDLHGNAKKQEVTPSGGKDENVFDIMQGVSVVLMVKTKNTKTELGEVYHTELWGKRQDKFDSLTNNSLKYQKLNIKQPNYFYTPKDFSLQNKYDAFISLQKLFIVSNSGIKTDRDSLFIDEDKTRLTNRIEKLLSGSYSDEFIKQYRVVDSGSYKLTSVIKNKVFNNNFIAKIQYRPFDINYIYYDPSIISRPAQKVMKHMVEFDNFLLNTSRTLPANLEFNRVLITNTVADVHTIGDQNYSYPLYLYHPNGTRTTNFVTAELSALTQQLSGEPQPEDILDYIYAVLHSPSYRDKYKEFLKIDFPRVPIPSQSEFDRLVPLGRKLRQLHLMKSPMISNFSTTYPVAGDNEISKVDYNDGKVYINNQQYFGNVPKEAWEFYIGGYQPAQKWLKSRRGQILTSANLEHYQKIIIVLIETNKIMGQIG